jgi:hypothetical protein
MNHYPEWSITRSLEDDSHGDGQSRARAAVTHS